MKRRGRPLKRIAVVKNPVRPSGWTCGACGRVLSRRDALLRHMSQIHDAPFTLLDSEKRKGEPTWEPEP